MNHNIDIHPLLFHEEDVTPHLLIRLQMHIHRLDAVLEKEVASPHLQEIRNKLAKGGVRVVRVCLDDIGALLTECKETDFETALETYREQIQSAETCNSDNRFLQKQQARLLYGSPQPYSKRNACLAINHLIVLDRVDLLELALNSHQKAITLYLNSRQYQLAAVEQAAEMKALETMLQDAIALGRQSTFYRYSTGKTLLAKGNDAYYDERLTHSIMQFHPIYSVFDLPLYEIIQLLQRKLKSAFSYDYAELVDKACHLLQEQTLHLKAFNTGLYNRHAPIGLEHPLPTFNNEETRKSRMLAKYQVYAQTVTNMRNEHGSRFNEALHGSVVNYLKHQRGSTDGELVKILGHYNTQGDGLLCEGQRGAIILLQLLENPIEEQPHRVFPDKHFERLSVFYKHTKNRSYFLTKSIICMAISNNQYGFLEASLSYLKAPLDADRERDFWQDYISRVKTPKMVKLLLRYCANKQNASNIKMLKETIGLGRLDLARAFLECGVQLYSWDVKSIDFSGRDNVPKCQQDIQRMLKHFAKTADNTGSSSQFFSYARREHNHNISNIRCSAVCGMVAFTALLITLPKEPAIVSFLSVLLLISLIIACFPTSERTAYSTIQRRPQLR